MSMMASGVSIEAQSLNLSLTSVCKIMFETRLFLRKLIKILFVIFITTFILRCYYVIFYNCVFKL